MGPVFVGILLWQIGSPDDDYHEFAIAGNYAAYLAKFPHDATFVVGGSDPKRDWPYIHPGPADFWAGSRKHTFRIVFDLPNRPTKGFCRLTVDFVNTHYARPPSFVVSINGRKTAEFEAPCGGGDAALTNPKAGREYVARPLIPADLLNRGKNILALTVERGSWALYDFLALEANVPPPKGPEVERFEVRPLPLFKRFEGKVQRVALAVVDNWGLGGVEARITGKVGQEEVSSVLKVGHGQTRLYIPLPDVKEETPAEFYLHLGGRRLSCRTVVRPARRWLVFVVPTVHTDIGYTDLQSKVELRHAENTEKILGALPRFPSLVWTVETFWQLQCFLRHRPERADELFQRLREGRIGLCALFGNMLTGLCSHEVLNRVCLHAKRLAKEHGFEVVSAILDDVPSAVASLPTVLANSGVRYLIEGVNRDRAPYAAEELKNPFYWEGPDGSRVLCHIDPGYAEAGGLLPGYETALERVPALIRQFDRPDYPYDAILVNGAFGDNSPVALWFAEVAERWNEEWAYPRIVLSRPEDFFRHMEENFRDRIPVLKGDFGSWWEDGAASSAHETALCRRAEERAVCAEIVNSLASLLAESRVPSPESFPLFDQLWRSILLYDEHTWGAWCSISQPKSEQTVKQWEVKASFAQKADELSRKLLRQGLDKLGEAVGARKGEVLVVNALSWPRTGPVFVPSESVPEGGEFVAMDLTTGERLPCQRLSDGSLCFIAEDVPSLGFGRYRVETLRQKFPDAVRFFDSGMENEFFRVEVDKRTGAVRSLLDKRAGRDLVDKKAGFLLGEVVYVEGGEGTRAVHPDPRLPEPKFKIHPQEAVRIARSQSGPVLGELAVEAKCKMMPKIRLKIRLYRDIPRLDLIYEIEKEETLRKEAVYIAFPFDLDVSRGGLWLEYPDAIVEPLKDQVDGACRDWYAVQRWAAASDERLTVLLSPLDTPLLSLGGMNAGKWLKSLCLDKAHFFAYVMNNYWHTNYKASQGGRFVFRFSIATWPGKFDRARAVKEGWGLFSPLLCVAGRGVGRPREVAGSLVRIEPPDLALLTLKRGEDGEGFVLRLWNPTGRGLTAKVSLPLPVREAWLCNLVEEPQGRLEVREGEISVPIRPFGLATVKVLL